MKDARTILSKKHSMTLIEKGFKLIDIQQSIKIPGELAFIFHNSPELEEEYNILTNAERILKNMYGLTFKNIRTLIGVLQGYPIEDDERYSIMEKLQVVDDLITGYKAQAVSDETVKEESDIENVANQLAEITAEKLKNAMNGSK